MATHLYLVRHAHADGADDADPPLSERGRAQAVLLGARLAGRAPVCVLHGPRRRTRETARLVARSLPDATVEQSALLDDRTPVPSPERAAGYSGRLREWLAAVPDDERDVDGELITRALGELVAATRSAPAPIVAVTHAFVVGWMVRSVLGAPADAWADLVPANAGLTVLDCGRGAVRVEAYNDTGHLAAPRDETFWLATADYDTRHARLLGHHVRGDEAVLLVDANGDDQHVDEVVLHRQDDGTWEEASSDMDVPRRRLRRDPTRT